MKKFSILLILGLFLFGCASMPGTTETNEDQITVPYYVALRAFNGAWDSYHKVWLQLPEDQKKEWVEKYHKTFYDASIFLSMWASDPDNPDPTYDGDTWKMMKDKIEALMIQLAINNSK